MKKKLNYEIVDDFLPEKEAKNIKNIMMSPEFAWFFQSYVSRKDEISNDFYFTHTFYKDYKVNSNLFSITIPLIEKIQPKSIVRIKGNLYPNTNTLIKNNMHQDCEFEHKAAIYYINTNNGYTGFKDGTKIESVENRIVFFDGSILHHSTNCTDQKIRVNINMNYF